MDDKRSMYTRCTPGFAPFLGRLLISLIFILSGLSKAISFSAVSAVLAQKGIQGASAFLFVAMLMELIGGLLILLGWYTRLGCWILMIFLLPTTLLFHNFWSVSITDQANQLAHFLKNLTIYGGLILLVCYGPGRWSIDAKRRSCGHF